MYAAAAEEEEAVMIRRILPLTQSCYYVVTRHCSAPNVTKEMREILRLAVTGDLETAVRRHEVLRETNDVPDWGLVKLSSVLLANGRERESEELLKKHYEETGGQHRFARKSDVQEEQVLAALIRVINRPNSLGLKPARQLYRWLLDGRFCSNKDVFIELFVEKTLQSDGIAAALTELEQLRALGRVKSLTRTFYRLLCSAMEHGAAEELSQVENVISSSTSPSSLQRLKGFLFLELGKKAAFVESLGENLRLEHGYLRYIVELATKVKAVNALESLLELSMVLQLRPQDKASIYDELVKMYGKREDAQNLERMLNLVMHEPEKQAFSATLGRLAHFYRCCNMELPRRLLRAV